MGNDFAPRSGIKRIGIGEERLPFISFDPVDHPSNEGGGNKGRVSFLSEMKLNGYQVLFLDFSP